MELAENDLIVFEKFNNKREAIAAVKELLEIIKYLREKHGLRYLCADRNVFNEVELCDQYWFTQLFSEPEMVLSRDEKTALKTFLNRYRTIKLTQDVFTESNTMRESGICAWAFCNKVSLISLPMSNYLEREKMTGIISFIDKEDEISVSIPNISSIHSVKSNGNNYGLRYYDPNPKHKIDKGWGSPMDLDQATAQSVLNDAVALDHENKHLGARHNGVYYSFRMHEVDHYHGYIDNAMRREITSIIDAHYDNLIN